MRDSPARAEPHDATAWLPLPDLAEMPPLEHMLEPDPDAQPSAPRDVPVGLPSPARAEPHDATAWLPLPELEELPSVDALLEPDPTVAPTTPRDVPVGLPSPARAEPHDAMAWLPLPEFDPVPAAEGDDGEPPRRGHRTRTRRFHFPVRGALTVLAIAAAAAGGYLGVKTLLDKGDDVVVRVDGQTIATETGVATVGEVLAEHDVQLGEYDRAVPDVSTPIENNMDVRVIRAFTVPVSFDGSAMVVNTTYHRPNDGFVADAAKQLSPDAPIGVRDAPKRIGTSTTVVMRTIREGVAFADGEALDYKTPALTPREVFEDLGIVLDDADVSGPIALDAVLPTVNPDGSKVAIALRRVSNEFEEIDEPYTLPDELRPDPLMQVTTPYRVVPGSSGMLHDTYQIIRQNGVAVDRVLAASEVITAAVPNITYYGTAYDPRWDKLAMCETGQNWAHTGSGNRGPNTYQGGTGIWSGNWDAYRNEIIAEGGFGGADAWPKDANLATKYQQIIIGERIKDDHGWGAWGCGKTLGYAKEDGKRIT